VSDYTYLPQSRAPGNQGGPVHLVGRIANVNADTAQGLPVYHPVLKPGGRRLAAAKGCSRHGLAIGGYGRAARPPLPVPRGGVCKRLTDRIAGRD